MEEVRTVAADGSIPVAELDRLATLNSWAYQALSQHGLNTDLESWQPLNRIETFARDFDKIRQLVGLSKDATGHEVFDVVNGLVKVLRALYDFCHVFMTPEGTLLEDNEYLAWCGVTAAQLELSDCHPDAVIKMLGLDENGDPRSTNDKEI